MPTPGAGTGGSPRPVAPNGLPPGSITAGQLGTGIVGGVHVDPTQVQAQVGGSCPVGQYLRAINQNGSVTCEPLLLPVTASANVSGVPDSDLHHGRADREPLGKWNWPFGCAVSSAPDGVRRGRTRLNGGSNSLGSCYLSLSTGELIGSVFDQLALTTNTLPLAGTRDVEAGTYDIQIRCYRTSGNGWINAQISVIAIPR